MSQVPLSIDEPSSGRWGLTIVLAPGAGAGMDSGFMQQAAGGLCARGLRVVRFDFPYMCRARTTQKKTRPDPPAVLERVWMEVIDQLGDPSRLVIGGKSMGGRIASMIADGAGVRGLVCLGYPFHPAGRPGILRVSHLEGLRTPSLFLQGERDALGSREETAGYCLSPAIRLVFLPDGDHSFRPRKASGRTFEDNLRQAISEIVAFCGERMGKRTR